MTTQQSHDVSPQGPSASAPITLVYDADLYQKYDTGGPVDDVLKTRELAVVLHVLAGAVIETSLDIGAATGRYPSLLAARGVRAFGVDCEPAAIAFARGKIGQSGNPNFEVADARSLPFENARFDLITCMMGTAAHFNAEERHQVMREVYRCLAPGGTFVVSTWNSSCKGMEYLSIYSDEQKEELRRNSMTPGQACDMLAGCGLVVSSVHPIEVTPLDGETGIRFAQATDAAAFVNAQMFVVVARKSGAATIRG